MSSGFFLKYPDLHWQYGVPLESVHSEYCKSHLVFWAKHRLSAKQKEVLQNKRLPEVNSVTKSAFQNSILGAKRAPLKTVLSVCIAWQYYHISEVVEWRIRTEGDGFEIRVCCRQRVLNGTVIGEMVLKLNGAVWVRPAAVSQGHLDAVEDIRAGHIGGEWKHAHRWDLRISSISAQGICIHMWDQRKISNISE